MRIPDIGTELLRLQHDGEMAPRAAGGILVRCGQELTSDKHPERLSTGALVEALDISRIDEPHH